MTEQLSVFGSTNKEDMKRKGEELFLNRGYEQLMGNYYPNRFRDLEYKFTNEEIREETDESFLYQAVAYVAGTENGKRSEMKLNYEVKIVKVNNIFMVLEQKRAYNKGNSLLNRTFWGVYYLMRNKKALKE